MLVERDNVFLKVGVTEAYTQEGLSQLTKNSLASLRDSKGSVDAAKDFSTESVKVATQFRRDVRTTHAGTVSLAAGFAPLS
jgi:hypothetical protein